MPYVPGVGVSASLFKSQSIAGIVRGMADHKREVLNGVVTEVNVDGSYNVYVKANGTMLYAVPRNDTRRSYSINDNVLLVRKEGNRESIAISGLSGYASAKDFEEVDIAGT
jgi:hypothetical protein